MALGNAEYSTGQSRLSSQVRLHDRGLGTVWEARGIQLRRTPGIAWHLRLKTLQTDTPTVTVVGVRQPRWK